MQPILKHHFTNRDGNLVSAYWYEDRYRYAVSTCMGIEYRELGPDPEGLLQTIPSTDVLETYIDWDTFQHVYHDHQMKAKCIRCSKHHGAPRKEYNLASICNRCYSSMRDISNTAGNTEYEINPDGSKGSVIK